ncbi:MAG: M20/M25/M40 family metallo-hydrolase [Thermoleophilia bacterium]|nr:M20/M25/M40 family metallo-hydrolase [Thermoleophilia bacterium]
METTPGPRPGYDFVPPPRQQEPTVPAPATAQPGDAEQEMARLLAALDFNREFAHLSILASDEYQGRKTGTTGAEAAAGYISSQFAGLGLEPWTAVGLQTYSQPFVASGVSGENVIGTIPGTDPAGGYVILAAHYDHLGLNSSGEAFNGADDNAAGVAAILEIANIFRQTGVKTEKTIVFCAFDGEEIDQLGSTALGQIIINSGLGSKVEMINIDGIGAMGGNYFGVWDEGFSGAAPIVESIKQAGNALGTEVVEEGTDIGSDAQSFDWKYSIPAVTVDWDWGSDPSVWHTYYHTIYDDPGNIDHAVMAQATRIALVSLWLRATKP